MYLPGFPFYSALLAAASAIVAGVALIDRTESDAGLVAGLGFLAAGSLGAVALLTAYG